MILIIDNYDSFTHNIYQALSILQANVQVIRNDKVTVADIEKMDLRGIVLSPGPGHPEDAGICIELIQKLGSKIPILGVCLGHQAIGAAFGAHVNQAKDIYHGKESLIFHGRKNIFKGISLPFKAGRYHSLIVDNETLPDTLEVTAEDASGQIMALKHKLYPLFGVQFHPESILTPEGNKIMKNFLDFCHLYNNKELTCLSN